MIKIVSITIERVEGPVEDTDFRKNEYKSFREADEAMLKAAETAPKNGTYDKCDFEVLWDNGDTYSGRYDMKSPDARGFEYFSDYVWGGITFYAGFNMPSHFTLAKYEEFLGELTGNRDYCKRLLEEYELLSEDTFYKYSLLRDRDARLGKDDVR